MAPATNSPCDANDGASTSLGQLGGLRSVGPARFLSGMVGLPPFHPAGIARRSLLTEGAVSHGPKTAICLTRPWPAVLSSYLWGWGPRFASWVDTLYKLTVFHHQDAVYKHEHYPL
jgi:hypothetical protein